ncbi:molybdate ABC transporter permease subunit, partial [Acinetobacter nosocomialis]
PNGEEMAMRLVVLSIFLAFTALIANYFILQNYQRKLGG